jgi:hypothetical protein
VLASSLALSFALGACQSESLDDAASGGASGAPSSTGGSATGGATHVGGGQCSGALRQAITLIDKVTPGSVSLLDQVGSELVLYIDASTGGIGGQDIQPWVYISLRTGARVDLTDLEALTSTDWDLALKRSTLRTNSGDSGPGAGGALRVTRAWASITPASVQGVTLPVETWFDADCVLLTDATGGVATTFTSWNVYDETTHKLAPAPSTAYVVAGADGALYKVAILDYYSKPNGTTGATDGGHYKLRVAPLE